MTPFREAPLQFILEVKRRLEKTTPGAVLDEKSVKLAALPKTQFDCTIFMFQLNGKTKLVAELAKSDLPHVFVGKTIQKPESRRELAAALIWCVTQLGWKIIHDPRFRRSNIIRINGFAHA